MREAAESTKLGVVHDASGRGSEKSPSLNECLEAGPPLQNRLLAVLVRVRFQPVALTGDRKQALEYGKRIEMRYGFVGSVTSKHDG